METQNLISLLDAGFVASIIAVMEILKATIPALNASSTLKRVTTVVLGVVGAFLMYKGQDMSLLETFANSLKLIIETVGTYSLLVKPVLTAKSNQ
jgi:type IV secretory pathway VirB2 component (pilin)